MVLVNPKSLCISPHFFFFFETSFLFDTTVGRVFPPPSIFELSQEFHTPARFFCFLPPPGFCHRSSHLMTVQCPPKRLCFLEKCDPFPPGKPFFSPSSISRSRVTVPLEHSAPQGLCPPCSNFLCFFPCEGTSKSL